MAGPFVAEGTPLFKDGSADWNDAFIVPGPVVEHDEVYYMFYTGHTFEGAGVDRGHVGYLTSPDGTDWAFGDEEPLFDGADLDWGEGAVYPSSAMVLDDGTWALWFTTTLTQFSTRGRSIGRATAPGPDGPWVIDPDPVLTGGGEGTWYERGVMHASVVRTGTEWRMYFDGYRQDVDSEADRAISFATSTDGVTWELYDDPATGGIYDGSDPVLFPGESGAWDAARVAMPSVVATEDGYVMTYQSSWRLPTPGFLTDFGYATSDDGISWERGVQNPLLGNDGELGFITYGTASLVEDQVMLYFDGASAITSPSSTIYRLYAPVGSF